MTTQEVCFTMLFSNKDVSACVMLVILNSNAIDVMKGSMSNALCGCDRRLENTLTCLNPEPVRIAITQAAALTLGWTDAAV